MSPHRMIDDANLTASDVQTLASRDGVTAFFATLGYDTDSRQAQTADAMDITAESLKKRVQHVERIAFQDDGAEPLDVYLVELTSVTVAATKGLATALKNRAGNYLLVLTDDYQRLDFVLLERLLPEETASPFLTKQVTVRPRILTVDRPKPTQVQLRVLRRFTYTEADSDAQFDKLLSAYAVADWSEPLFNNRALFSDYYLKERLPELNQWAQRPEATYHQLRQLLADARGAGDQQPTVKSFLEPALQALGFSLSPASGEGEPDYRLHDPANPEKPVAACLAYTWNRKLDGRDDERDTESPEENPGARVVTVIESGDPPWAIITNGKLWRLYSARTHSRSTNYYEIDLEETLAMDDPNEAFRYFWLFFRLNAFTTRELVRDGRSREMCFLDELLDDSEAYAKKLGDRLKERVFEQIFPYFAEGFIEHLKGQADMAGNRQPSLMPVVEQLALKREPDEEFRRQTFQGTLTLLYRLLFLLYAESRDLLPVKERRGYFERSLTELKQEIAEKAGPIEDYVEGRLQQAYSSSADATQIYDRLLDLFSVIDRGSNQLNVPLYDGGLFLTQPGPDTNTPEAEAARFLASHKIPDLYLALGLDRLARDLDDKSYDLVFIDYKSLGVRQLGSIYEGLLEFRIRIAQETMAVVKGKKTEQVIPYAEAGRKGRRVLKKGRGRDADERVYAPGKVYLENDRRERKASGSYYTPDHIVRYIVEHTVGPVLEQELEKLRPRLRDAQQAYGKALVRAKSLERQGLKPDDPAKVANDFTGIVDDLFDLKVLDPAMGSGHFLVEAVDFICDRILGQRDGFLRAFPWNPVTRYLDDTREAIKTEMERQGVVVDAGRLTDVNLLKRHVLKRCAYGVDLNPMAVELAKVSLWLDCFTVGAPLSFLDHHLKCGNSLIGTTVQEVEAELAEQAKGFVADLFGGPFQGLLSATATIEELRRIPDATVEQAERSRGLFAEFERAQAPYKSALDIWVSRHFGNKRAQEYLTTVGTNIVDQMRSGGEGLPQIYLDAISQAREVAREKRFFHWDLEFPEAFVDLKHRRWKPKDQQGFDAVVGNPPYGVSLDAREKSLWKNRFRIKGRPLNIAGVFYSAGVKQWSINAAVGMIVPKSVTFSRGWAPIVEIMLPHLTRLIDVSKAFPEVLLEQVIAICGPGSVRSYLSGVMSEGSLTVKSLQRKESARKSQVLVTGVDEWETHLSEKLLSSGLRFGNITDTFRGLSWQRFATAGGHELLVAGRDIVRYSINSNSSSLSATPIGESGKVKRLRQRKIVSQNIVAHIGKPIPHIRIIAALDSNGFLNLDTVNNTISLDENWPLEVLLALLNSKIYSWYMYRFIYNQAIRTMHFDAPYVARLPLPNSQSKEQNKTIIQLARSACTSRKDGRNAEFERTDSQIDAWVYRAFCLNDVEVSQIEETTFHGNS